MTITRERILENEKEKGKEEVYVPGGSGRSAREELKT